MKLLKVSPSPHIRSSVSTASVMRDVIIALSPALIWAVYIFGFRALTVTLISVLSCVGAEYAFCAATKRKHSIKDLSAVVTGIILAFNLPVSVPLWLPMVGGVFAIVIVKMLFGGIGKNFLNPALAARVFLFLSFPAYMSGSFVKPAHKLSAFAISTSLDGVSSATPLTLIHESVSDNMLVDMFYGNIGGCLGEVSKLCLLLGLVYLLVRKVITWHIPFAYLSVFFLISFAFPMGEDEAIRYALSALLSGGVVLGAVFMATDYSTSPLTATGKLIFGALCGALTVFFRYFSNYPEGASFAILIMNCFVYYIDRITQPVKFGGGKNAGK
ncbi:MAG: RnfABCDGE type electron transport complex subunit D [Clostridia bacterium]|nr:RnfABCDGE type electron transport complex subunit D [Clostridia bacterium]